MAIVIFTRNGKNSSRPLCTEKDLLLEPGEWEKKNEGRRWETMMWYWAARTDYTYETVEEE
jgi:hypothetical protein